MTLNDREQKILNEAEAALPKLKLTRTLTLIALALAALLLLSGLLDSRGLNGLALFLVAIAVGQPNMVKAPKYEDLVSLLRKKNQS